MTALEPGRAARRLGTALAVAALTIAAADLLQVAVVPWRPKHWGALGGAALYGALGIAAARGARWPGLVAAVIPAIPLTILGLTAAGVGLPVAPDAAMLAILTVQLAAAGLGVARWRAG